MVYITNMNDNQQINDDYIVSLFFTSKTNSNRIRKTTSYIIDNNDDIKNYLINRFPDFRNDFKEVLHRIKYNIEEIPKCPICGKPLKYYGLSSMLYGKTCSRKCQYEYMKTEEFQSKMDYTSYMSNPENIKRIQEKRKQKIDGIKEKTKRTLLERYGDSHYNNRNKCRQTCLEKYGVDSPMLLDSVKNKIKETNIKRYGVEWSAQNKEINQKTIDTQIKKYGGVFNPEKVKKTNIEKYGVEKPFMSSDIQNKIRSKIDIILQKVNNTKRINGTFNSSNTEKASKTLLIKKFGIDNVIEQYKSDLYPFYCDFYIKNLDLYIECNYHWTHGGHIFNKDNINDIEKLNKWKQKNTKFYNNAIEVWTKRDQLKIKTAKDNNLNYKAFYSLDELKQYLEI